MTDVALLRFAKSGSTPIELDEMQAGETLAVANGGTGATTAAAARTSLGAAASGANSDITSLSAPALGAATATTATSGDSTTKVATTAFVASATGSVQAAIFIGAAGGTADALTATPSPALASYVDGAIYEIRPTAGLNTSTTPTLNISGLGVKTIVKGAGLAVAAGDIGGFGSLALLAYHSSNGKMVLLNPMGNSALYLPCNGRLSLSSTTTVPTTDLVAQTGIYFSPFGGKSIALFDGTSWMVYSLSQISLSVGTVTSGLPYDIFVYNNAGTLTLESLAWTNGSTRATGLVLQDGVLVKSGATSRRYLGTFYTTSTTTTEDSAAKRYLWNYYNRVDRPMYKLYATASWTYSTNTWRQANADTANQIDFVIGVVEDAVFASVTATATIGGTGASDIGLGLNSTTAPGNSSAGRAFVKTTEVPACSNFTDMPALGKNYIAWLEIAADATTTWYSNSNSHNAGLTGRIRA
jgi:hypothetical protein